ncbi:MAG: hypothetical protein IH804_07925 [Planctomycetes bacterium]|nr:hypothetical protein [Planctomycetota bacterium]
MNHKKRPRQINAGASECKWDVFNAQLTLGRSLDAFSHNFFHLDLRNTDRRVGIRTESLGRLGSLAGR